MTSLSPALPPALAAAHGQLAPHAPTRQPRLSAVCSCRASHHTTRGLESADVDSHPILRAREQVQSR